MLVIVWDRWLQTSHQAIRFPCDHEAHHEVPRAGTEPDDDGDNRPEGLHERPEPPVQVGRDQMRPEALWSDLRAGEVVEGAECRLPRGTRRWTPVCKPVATCTVTTDAAACKSDANCA
eukprot:TRINITY_DN765_c1_g1_i12.p3 TRINITY_DN765_c1_g1~~TRINITY_DN765_c1_g1_i12.p3  ORF type:complete len:118 (+),score=7.28 TRINITY_DN765_c1_g1_i12:155-508(+)